MTGNETQAEIFKKVTGFDLPEGVEIKFAGLPRNGLIALYDPYDSKKKPSKVLKDKSGNKRHAVIGETKK